MIDVYIQVAAVSVPGQFTIHTWMMNVCVRSSLALNMTTAGMSSRQASMNAQYKDCTALTIISKFHLILLSTVLLFNS